MRAVRQFLRAQRVPLIAVALAVLHSLLFWSLGPRVPLGLFIAAVMVSAWQGGIRPALLATGLSVPLLALIAHYQAPAPGTDLVLRLGLFVLVGLIAGYLSQQCRLAIRAVDHVHEVLGGGGIALLSADVEGRVTSINPLARTLTGRDADGTDGLPLGEVFHVVHGPARQPVPLPPPGTAQELPEGTLLVRRDGSETAIEGNIGPVRDSAGRPTGVMVVFREAGGRSEAWHELRRRADRFRALAGYAPAGLMVLDAEGRCVFSNPAAQTACGCTADESLGEGWSRHVEAKDRDRLIGDWLRAVVARQPFADDFQIATGSGAGPWLRLRSSPMLADSGEVLGHVAALEEITERRRAEEALAEARRESAEQLQEWAAAEEKAAEAARKAQGQLDERGTALRRAEEALAAARAETEQKLREAMAEREQAEADSTRLRAELAKANANAEAAPRQAVEEAARLREEVARLGEELAGHRDTHERLQSALAEKDGTAESLRNELARLGPETVAAREAHDRLQALLAERSGSEEALRQSHDRLQNLLAEKKGHEESLRREIERLQAALAEKDGAEESLRQELERLRVEAAGRRQAEEAHAGLRVEIGERDRREESLRDELARLRGDKEFLEGVIDGSPAGIFAHDRDGRCRVWNAALERLLGRARADALGRTAAELFPPVEPRTDGDGDSPSDNGADRAGLATVGVVGRSEFFESTHARVRDAGGEVVGGMTLVRVLPRLAEEGLAPSTRGGTATHRLAVGRLGDIDWLAFN